MRLAELVGDARQLRPVGEKGLGVAARDPVLQGPQRAGELEWLLRPLLTTRVACREQSGRGKRKAQEKPERHGFGFRSRISMRRFCAASGSFWILRLRSA